MIGIEGYDVTGYVIAGLNPEQSPHLEISYADGTVRRIDLHAVTEEDEREMARVLTPPNPSG